MFLSCNMNTCNNKDTKLKIQLRGTLRYTIINLNDNLAHGSNEDNKY